MNKELDKMCKQFEQDLKSGKIRYATQEEVEQYNNNEEIKLILTKLKLVSEIEESGAYICDKEHSKILLDCITNLQEKNERLLHIAKKMHTYIFLNTDNEQEAYDKLGLTEKENIMLGYSGQIIIKSGDNNE